MECKENSRSFNRLSAVGIDLTRMECKVVLVVVRADSSVGIDLTRMECKEVHQRFFL